MRGSVTRGVRGRVHKGSEGCDLRQTRVGQEGVAEASSVKYV